MRLYGKELLDLGIYGQSEPMKARRVSSSDGPDCLSETLITNSVAFIY